MDDYKCCDTILGNINDLGLIIVKGNTVNDKMNVYINAFAEIQ